MNSKVDYTKIDNYLKNFINQNDKDYREFIVDMIDLFDEFFSFINDEKILLLNFNDFSNEINVVLGHYSDDNPELSNLIIEKLDLEKIMSAFNDYVYFITKKKINCNELTTEYIFNINNLQQIETFYKSIHAKNIIVIIDKIKKSLIEQENLSSIPDIIINSEPSLSHDDNKIDNMEKRLSVVEKQLKFLMEVTKLNVAEIVSLEKK